MKYHLENPFYMSKQTQSCRLEFMIEQCNSFEDFEKRFPDEFLADDERAGNYLDKLMVKYEQKAATLSEAAGLHRSFVGNILNGRKEPSRDSIIAICLAMKATLEELQTLLKFTGHAPLYVRRKRDVIIWFGIMKKKTIVEIDIDLHERGYKTFFKTL